jgi:hypothetical protein
VVYRSDSARYWRERRASSVTLSPMTPADDEDQRHASVATAIAVAGRAARAGEHPP